MKRFISLLLTLSMLLGSVVFVSGAEENPAIRIVDTSGTSGCATSLEEISAMIKAEGGATLIMDVLVEETFAPGEGMSAGLSVFTGGNFAKYNILSYDFNNNMFKAGQSTEWIGNAQDDYTAIQTNSFEWKCGRWYELAFRFNGKKAAIYLDGICVISTAFDVAMEDYLIVYPAFCAVRFDNIRVCAKDYNVAEDTGAIWASEDFTDALAVGDAGIFSFDSAYSIEADAFTTAEPGDANGDGDTNASDLSALRRYLSGGYVKLYPGADADGDGEVDIPDLSFLERMLSGADLAPEDSTPNVTPITPDDSAVVEEDLVISEEAVAETIAAIDAIGTVTYKSLSLITAAEAVFASLNSAEKELVTNYAVLTAARAEWDALDAEVIAYKDAVAGLPAVADASAECEKAIAKCAIAYATLNSPGQVDAVKAEKAKYDAFRAEWEKIIIDNDAVAAAISAIDAIGTVTYKSLSLITTAETAYAALNTYEKRNVTNSAVLTEARDVWDALDAEVVAYKAAVAELPATASASTECEKAIAKCAIAYATLNSPGQVDAVKAEKAKYDAFRAEWEKIIINTDAVAATITKIDLIGTVTYNSISAITDAENAYEALNTYERRNVTNYAVLTAARAEWDALDAEVIAYKDAVAELPAVADATDASTSAVVKCAKAYATLTSPGQVDAVLAEKARYDAFRAEWEELVIDKDAVAAVISAIDSIGTVTYNSLSAITAAETAYKNLKSYEQGKVTNYTALVDARSTYDMLDAEVVTYKDTVAALPAAASATDECKSAIAKCAIAYATLTSPGQVDAVKTEKAKYDAFRAEWERLVAEAEKKDSSLKFDSTDAASYTLVLNEGPISNSDVALTFDVYVESIDSSASFAGLGVWNGDGTFIGYDFKDQKFTAQKSLSYPYPPDEDVGGSLALKVGTWNNFVFRRLNNNSFLVFVNGTKYAEVTDLSFSNTYMIFGFKNCVAYIDNYQAYENGAGKGLCTDFSQFTTRSDGALISPDGGYWIVGTQGLSGVSTAVCCEAATGSGYAGTSDVPGSSAINGVGKITPATPVIPVEPTPPSDSGNSGGGSSGTGTIGASVDYSTKCTTGWELANRAAHIAKNYKTLYVMGCFGAPMTASNKARYTQNHSYNKNATRTAMINAASSDTFGFDCVCLIKGILWGWSAKLNTAFGGAAYASNGVPDFGTNVTNVYIGGARSTNWSVIEIGEAVWMSGHIGIYIGNGLAVECTPAWQNKVQITAVGNIGKVAGYNTRNWTAHGKLKYVTYTGSNDNPNTNGSYVLKATAGYVSYTIKSGDSLSSIGEKYGIDWQIIADYNGITDPAGIYVGQTLKIPV